ncbi:GspE/PulE family protein [soil metagenome]
MSEYLGVGEASSAIESEDERLANALLSKQLLSNEWLMMARRHAQEQHIPLRQSVIELHLLEPDQIAEATAEQPNEVTEELVESPLSGEVMEIEVTEPVVEGPDLHAQLQAIAATAVPSDLIQQLLLRALTSRATDVHIDPRGAVSVVRFRIDGRLHEMVEIEAETALAVTRGIKIISNMNLVETRHPQDGAMTLRYLDHRHNLRVSTLPTAEGEKVVMRILEPLEAHFDLGLLGLEPRQETLVHQFLSRPYGALLVGGPVGAGKTTTLYSCLHRVHDPSRNIVTIEDPVEYRFHGVNQVEINNQIGLTFTQGLRAILRQDPDVLMIGEIRDDETAAIGIRAALTGVLVFSTIHASDAAGTITTLFNFGIPGYALGSALQGVINQRLVRTICPKCRIAYQADDSVLRALRLEPEEHRGLRLFRGTGCRYCLNTGYRGRSGIFEVMDISEMTRELILMQTTREVIRQVARDEGMRTLRDSAIAKVIAGQTTIEEMYRVSS